jgi:uncharacterized integral membrane protein
MWIVKFILMVVVMSVVLLIAGLNASQTVDLNLLFREYQQISVVLVILLSFISGMFVTLLISVFREMHLKGRIRREKKSRSRLEQELVGLKSREAEVEPAVAEEKTSEAAREPSSTPDLADETPVDEKTEEPGG